MTRLRALLIRALALCAGLAAGLFIIDASGLGRGRTGRAPVGPAASAPLASSTAPVSSWDAALGPPPRFVDVTESSGIDFVHENGKTGRYAYPEIMGAGVGLFDADGDGLLDIYFVNGNRLDAPSPDITNRLYRNRGGMTFTDVTRQAGVGGAGFGQGCCVGDYDNDGDPDLYVSNLGPNILYRNDGGLKFTDVTAAAGVGDPGWGQSCSFLDADKDGWLDLFVQNYLTYSADRKVEAFVYLGARKVLDYPTPVDFPGSPSRLFRNNRDGTFTDISREAGIDKPGGKGMGCACVDLDGDGWVDIFVANDSMENYWFRNRGNGTFEETALAAGLAYDAAGTPDASMGVDVGDFDRDGRPDLVCPCVRGQGFTLRRNTGQLFEDASAAAGLFRATSSFTGFSPNFIDYDDDGDLDLFFTTGGVRANELVREDASYVERYGSTDLLLASDGKGHFVDVSAEAGQCFRTRKIGRGSAAGDLDGDGDLDIVVSNLAGRPSVLRNDTAGGHKVTVKLVPRGGNRDALGAVVVVEAGGLRQTAWVHGAVSYLSQNDRRPHFGLGAASRIDRLEVRWPDGERQVLEGLPVDRVLTIEEGSQTVR